MNVQSRVWYLSLLLAPALLAQAPVRYDSGTISGLPARNIGSAEMSGRIAAVTAVNDSGRLTVFAASASGGVWKSVNGGTTFKSVFDLPDVQSIGAVAIDPANAKIVWVGTGESWVRNSVSIGDGIYKSIDGGENWKNAGLKDSEHIAKILIDPKDGNVVYACATGHLWDDNDERGVYKTSDGGQTWRKVLAGANGSTGDVYKRQLLDVLRRVEERVRALPRVEAASFAEMAFDEGVWMSLVLSLIHI